MLQTGVMNYGGTGATISFPAAKTTGEPDFKSMTAAEKVAYHRAKWTRILG